MNTKNIYVALGTNIGDKQGNIQRALSLMEERGIKVIKSSSLYVTEPYGFLDQDEFLNGVVEVSFPGTPGQLLELLMEIEQEMKRIREIHWGPRIIDLDIILFGQRIIKEPDLIIPHTDMHNRDFVLRPLAEIAPKVVHPVLQKTIQQLFDELHTNK